MISFDEEMKVKFVDDLQKGLFEKHKSFLSNPLLLSIMLLTYGQSAHIPTKLNVFYNQAYEALFQRHDALKGGFQRERRTKLDIQDFAKVFAVFCLQTFDKGRFEFSRIDALGYIAKAKEITGLEYKNEDYLNDSLQAVCLLVEDGLMIVFAHRSFQEYFTARFIAETKPEIQEPLVRKYSKNWRSDTVISLLYEIRPDVVEQYYIIPGIKRFRKFIRLKDKIGLIQYTRYLKAYHSFEFREDGYYALNEGPYYQNEFGNLISFIIFNCGHLIDWKGFHFKRDNFEELFKKYGGKGKIETKGFRHTDQIVRDLANTPGYFSLKTLEDVIKIDEVIKEKNKNTEASLTEVLSL